MKKTLKMSAFLLTILATFFMVACSSESVAPEVNEVATILNNITKDFANAETEEGATRILNEVGKLGQYNNSKVVLSESDAKVLVEALNNMATKNDPSNKISEEEKSDAVDELVGTKLGDFVTTMQSEFWTGFNEGVE
ncbi:MAG: hypothetical protein NC097_07775 [Clostridium sp.]|nr:hypothetical protein [Prevotella sp.]MCM1429677.1 hypothetical protein [Clostridium sp.]MCM1476168.1 hypothetical protein [Muribaculaceae bacterium]